MFLELPKWRLSMWLGWLLLSAPRWRHLATCGDNRDNREHLTLALELPTLAAALVRLNCPGENKGWENISSFKYSWLAPSRPARCTIVPAIQLSHHGGRPLPRDRPVFRPVMSPDCGLTLWTQKMTQTHKYRLNKYSNILDTFYVDININNEAPYIIVLITIRTSLFWWFMIWTNKRYFLLL